MRVSIIIPARNEEAQLAETLLAVLRAVAHRSVTPVESLKLSATNCEVLVVDNGSRDGTSRILAEFAERFAVQALQTRRPGAAAARNFGAARARGDVLVFVDADTRVPPRAVTRIETLVGQKGCSAGIFPYAPQECGLRADCWWAFWNWVRLLPLARAKAMPAFMFCTRDVFREFGPFDESVAIGEEWPILTGLYRRNRRALAYDRTLTAHTSSRRMQRVWLGYTRLYVKYGLAILFKPARVRYSDRIREPAATQPVRD
jgi:glycosyltransferase involved in cell wall biosynthesis